MVEFGLMYGATEETLQPVEVGEFAEANGFGALFLGEHSHLPTAKHRYEGGISDDYKKFYDPFVALSMVAAKCERLTVGTGVCLLTEHHPITLAKTVATLDHASGGRVVLGVGTGWNDAEMANYGISFRDRWAVCEERVRAMKTIWTEDVAEYHGEYVDFDPLWCWPKPARPGGPPVLIGGGVDPEVIARRVCSFGDGWIPLEGGHEIDAPLAAIRAEAARIGRPMSELDLTVGLGLMGPVTEQRIREVIEMGFGRVMLLWSRGTRDEDWKKLEAFAGLIRPFLA